jgi:hypothetical protein
VIREVSYLNTRESFVVYRTNRLYQKLLVVLLASDVVCHGNSIRGFGVEMPFRTSRVVHKHVAIVLEPRDLPVNLVVSA